MPFVQSKPYEIRVKMLECLNYFEIEVLKEEYGDDIFISDDLSISNFSNEIKSEKQIFENNYVNALTKEIDKHMLVIGRNCNSNIETYIYKNRDLMHHLTLRFLGDNIGHIKVNDDFIITNIVFYDDFCFKKSEKIYCYDDSVDEIIQLFIGKKIELPE